MQRLICAVICVLSVTAASTASAAPSILKFWNMTGTTIISLSLAPAGSHAWSANLCLTDPDHAVDDDERLKLPAIAPGLYDVRVRNAKGRACVFHGVSLKGLGPYAFSLSAKQMARCGP